MASKQDSESKTKNSFHSHSADPSFATISKENIKLSETVTHMIEVNGPPPVDSEKLLQNVTSLVRQRPDLADCQSQSTPKLIGLSHSADSICSPSISEVGSLHSCDSYFWDSSVHISLSVNEATCLHESVLTRGDTTMRQVEGRELSDESSDTDCKSVIQLQPSVEKNVDEICTEKATISSGDDVGGKPRTKTRHNRKRKIAPNKGDTIMPNYFVAIQITNPEILSGLKRVQDQIVEGEARLKPAIVPLPTMHLTLMVMHLADDERLEIAKQALDRCSEHLTRQFHSNQPLDLTVHGLSDFRNNVVFGKVDDEASLAILTTISEMVQATFLEGDIVSTDQRGFQPHLTILKLSRAHWLKKQGVRKVDPSLYESLARSRFGTQRVTTLQLCSMTGAKSSAGYYYTAHCVPVRRLVAGTELHEPELLKTLE